MKTPIIILGIILIWLGLGLLRSVNSFVAWLMCLCLAVCGVLLLIYSGDLSNIAQQYVGLTQP